MTISREEFERLYSDMKEGFRGINARLDTQNGRIGKGEIERENLRTRLVSVEKEVFAHAPTADSEMFSSNKQKLYALIGFATIGVAVEVAKLVLGALVSAFVRGH